MKIEFNVGERILLLGLLPATGSIVTLRILREVREALSFSDEDHQKYAIKQVNPEDGKGQIQWNGVLGLETKEVEINDTVADMIRHKLTDLSKTNDLEMSMIRFYEIFVERKEVPPIQLPVISTEGRPIS